MAKNIRKQQGMTPKSDPNYPERLLLANGLCQIRANALVQQFNWGALPNPLTIREPKLRTLIAVLKNHYRYGHMKQDANQSQAANQRTQS
jgi:hypothetical protein